jgi:hypothetical protein
MSMAAQFKQRATAYWRKAREARSPDERQQYAAIAACCEDLARDNADVVIGVALAAETRDEDRGRLKHKPEPG